MADTVAGALDSVDTTGATVAVKPAAAKGKFLSPTLAGTQHLDTAAGASILENMQRLIDEKEAQKSSFLERLKDAAAWTGGGIQGPTEGLAMRGKAREEQTTDIYNMRMQLAQQRAAAEAAKQESTARNEVIPGALGAAGAPVAAPTSGAGMTKTQVQIASLPADLQFQAQQLARTGQWGELDKMVKEEYLKRSDAQKALAYADQIESSRPDLAKALRQQYLPEAMKPRLDVNAQGEPFNVPGMTAEQLSRNRPAPAPVAAPAPAPAALREPDVNRSTLTLAGPSANWTPAPPPAPGAETTPYESLPKADRMAVDYLEDQNKDGWLGKVKMPYVPPAAATPAAPVAVAPVIAPTAPVKPPVKTLGQIAAETKGAEEAATATAKEAALAHAGFMQSTDPYANADRVRSADRIVELVKASPEVFGVFVDPGVMNAIGTVVSQGANTPWGNISLGGLEDAVSKVKVDANGNLLSRQAQLNRLEAAQLVAKNELEFGKIVMKGQGATSDLERVLLKSASGSIKDPAEQIIKRQMMMSEMGKAEAADGALFRELYPKGGVAAYAEFRNRKEHLDLVAKFNSKADEIIKTDIKLPKSSGAAAAPAAPPARPVFKDAAEAKAFKAWQAEQEQLRQKAGKPK